MSAFTYVLGGCSARGGGGGDGSPVRNDNGLSNANVTHNDNDNRADGIDVGARPQERLASTDLTYLGAFRLPEEFNWGAQGISFYPEGDGGAGTLLVTGFELLQDPAHPGESCWNPDWDCGAYYGQVRIPTATRAAGWEDLPVAERIGALTPFDGGLASSVHREYVYVSALEYVPRRGSQLSDKLYGAINLWYAEGVAGSDTFPSLWFANLNGMQARGMFHVGPRSAPFHGRKTGSYLFTVPQAYADEYLGGRILITGRSRGTPADGTIPITTDGGSQGPTLMAFAPWGADDPTGNLDALPLLYYRVMFPACAGPNVGDAAVCDFPGFTMCDDWTGGSFVDNGRRRAVLLLGLKGLGENCYDEPPVECGDPCSDAHGYHCQPYERQVIFYDVHSLGASAMSRQDPWVVLPYEMWRPGVFYSPGHTCGGTGGMAFDAASRRLFMVERGRGGADVNAAVVHVWSL
ncbi:MAG: hypothetical protein IT449_09710 [Phycisphaerales bacterium]|nr:hypothetical protein [Phycisphaerales bacterium]